MPAKFAKHTKIVPPCAVHRGHEPDCRGCQAYAATLRGAEERDSPRVMHVANETGNDVRAEHAALQGDLVEARAQIETEARKVDALRLEVAQLLAASNVRRAERIAAGEDPDPDFSAWELGS